MERLTKQGQDYEHQFCDEVGCRFYGEPNGCNNPNYTCPSFCYFTSVAETLEKYEDTELTPSEINQLKSENAELKARLSKAVELPCVNGDIVYEIVLGNIEQRTVSGFAGGETVEWIYTVFEFNGKGYSRTFDAEELSKTVFLTEAEAQARLEEMKGGADKCNG